MPFLFIIHAYYEKRLSEVPKIIGYSILIGIVFGMTFDLVVGKLLGMYTYELGFGLFFLVLNGAFSYGFMQANVLLMQRVQALHFYLWTVIIGVVYEITNHFFPVWMWDFSSPLVEFVVVHSVGYIGLAIFMAMIWHFLLKQRFAFVNRIFLKTPR